MNKITWKYVKPLQNVQAVAEFELKNGVVIPDDLRAVIYYHNGGRPSLRYFDLPNEEDKEFKTLLSFNENDLENVYKRFPVGASGDGLLPFASDPAGNLLVLKEGAVYFWDHEKSQVIFVAPSFTLFIESLHN